MAAERAPKRDAPAAMLLARLRAQHAASKTQKKIKNSFSSTFQVGEDRDGFLYSIFSATQTLV
jgi:hypothetical protein